MQDSFVSTVFALLLCIFAQGIPDFLFLGSIPAPDAPQGLTPSTSMDVSTTVDLFPSVSTFDLGQSFVMRIWQPFATVM
jgi:hypothetical protein